MTDLAALVAMARCAGLYRARIVPAVRAQQAAWRRQAEGIPDDALREAALRSLDEKAANAEATGIFAALASRGRRRRVLRAITSFQIAVDYLDAVDEAPGRSLADGVRLHDALVDAVQPGGPVHRWYGESEPKEDGGFLAGLVDECRRELATLRPQPALLSALEKAARRCGEGQALTHAAAKSGSAELEAWARGLGAERNLTWWEVAAGASSSVAVHALVAAADPTVGRREAAQIDAAYFPLIGALTVLLDDLVDRRCDEITGEHSYLAYGTDDEMGARLGSLAQRAKRAASELPKAPVHTAILYGVIGFYLAAPEARTPSMQETRVSLLDGAGPVARIAVAAIRHLV